MAQVKKVAVREAILAGAFSLFAEKGYAATTLADIAARAGVAPSTVYVYFQSKLHILFAVYGPWLRERLEALATETRGIEVPRERLRAILVALWRDIPADKNGFANNFMQAFATATPEEGYSRSLLLECEAKVSAMIAEALPYDRRHLVEGDLLSHVFFMAFDGFALNYRLAGPSKRLERIVALMCDLLLGEEAAPGRARPGLTASA